jgi:hypothetical protein
MSTELIYQLFSYTDVPNDNLIPEILVNKLNFLRIACVSTKYKNDSKVYLFGYPAFIK